MQKNKFLLIATCGLKPSHNSFANFLNKSDVNVVKKVFVATLVLLNDLHFLDFVKLFVDVTDMLARASKYYKITKKEVNALIQVHKGVYCMKTHHNQWIKKMEIHKDGEELCKTINLVLKDKNIQYSYLRKKGHLF